MRLGFSLTLNQPRQRKDDRDAYGKTEQRENEIVEPEPFPGRMRELITDEAAGRGDELALAGGQFLH
jgi:hypothetical protein